MIFLNFTRVIIVIILYLIITDMYTPLIAAASSVHAQSVASCVTILLQKGADPNMHER